MPNRFSVIRSLRQEHEVRERDEGERKEGDER